MSVTSDLKNLRDQVLKLQIEVNGRKSIGSKIVWDELNDSSVNQKTSRRQEEFNGLVIHLTPENHSVSQSVGTAGLSQNEFKALKEQILGELDQSRS